MRNVLWISLAGPPKAGPESLQVAKLLKYINKRLLNIYFATDGIKKGTSAGWNSYDESLLEVLNGLKQVIRVNNIENRYYTGAIRKLAPHLLQKPDEYRYFHRNWRKIINKLDSHPNVIYSRSTPFSSALAALNVKNYFNVPWMMHLSDPWVESPLLHFSNKVKSFHEKAEMECFKKADLISFTSEKTVELYEEKYPHLKRKFLVMPNVFDDEFVNPKSFTFEKKIRIVHTGNLYGSRTPSMFLNVINSIYESHPNILNNVEILFAGRADLSILESFQSVKFPGFQYLGPLSYEKARDLQFNSSFLLLIDSNIGEDHAVFFPSKLLDYFAAKRPILAITSRNSTSRIVLQNYADWVFAHDQEAELKFKLISVITEYNNKNSRAFPNLEPDKKYSSSANASRLEEILLNI